MTAAVLGPQQFEEFTLAVSGDGSSIVEVVSDAGHQHIYQLRRAGRVLAEATQLRVLSQLLDAQI